MADLVLVTGASGFVGPHVVAALLARGYRVRSAQRRPAHAVPNVEVVTIGDLAKPFDWTQALSGVRHVVHIAGLAHADAPLPEALYDAVNRQATLALAQAAQSAGIARFVFLSSIRAQTGPASESVLNEDTPPVPTDAYGRSKLAAERGLAALDLDWIALRPVLVYGPGVKANMAMLARLARLPVPLPLGGLTGRRSLLSAGNLADAVLFALDASCPARRSFIVSDRAAFTLPEMIAAMRAGLGRRPGLVSVPENLLRLMARLIGKPDIVDKIAGGLDAPPTALMQAGWRPPVATEAGLAALAKAGSS